MPPPLALFLCTVFVLFLLRLERKHAPNVSHALWIPTIWMLCIATKPLAYWFGVYGEPGEGSPLDRTVLSILLCIGLIILARRKCDWWSALKQYPWFILLIGYMLISITWSDIQFISFKRWIRELIAVVMALLVLTERNPRQAVQSIVRRTVYILIPFSILLIKYFPKYGVDFGRWSGGRIWIGVTTQKNGLGVLCIIAAFFLIWSLIKTGQGKDSSFVRYQNHVDLFILILTLWLLRGPSNAYSATAVATLAVGLSVYAYLLMKRHRIKLRTPAFIAMLSFGIVFGIITVFVGGSTVSSFAGSLGRNQTLTGRTEIWARLIPIGLQQPLIGKGFGGFWTDKTRVIYDISEGHSGYLDVLLELGFIGLLLFSMFLLSSCWKAQKLLCSDFDWASLWICFLVMTVVHNITESSLNTFTSHLMAVLLFSALASKPTNHCDTVGLQKG